MLIIHYMDIVITHKNLPTLQTPYEQSVTELTAYGLIIASEKVQDSTPYNYLGSITERMKIHKKFKLGETVSGF